MNSNEPLVPVGRREYLKYTGALTGASLGTGQAKAQLDTERTVSDGNMTDERPTNLTVEYQSNPENLPPLSITSEPTDRSYEPFTPRFTWQADVDGRDHEQSAYRVLVASSKKLLAQNRADVWDSGKVESSRSTNVPYGGEPLVPEETYHWKVRIWDGDGEASEYSDSASFTTALPNSGSPVTDVLSVNGTDEYWEGHWITKQPDIDTLEEAAADEDPNISPLLRNEFEIDKKIEQARAHVVTIGYGELYLNGIRMGDEEALVPWTIFDKRCLYSTHDVTDELQRGENAVGLWLGRGFYSQKLNFPEKFAPTESDTTLPPMRGLLQLNIEYIDGTTSSVVTNTSWQASLSPLAQHDVYSGETYDARREQLGWSKPDFDDSDWTSAIRIGPPIDKGSAETTPGVMRRRPKPSDPILYPQQVQQMRITETFDPVSIEPFGTDSYIVDFGQNIPGWTELTIRGAEEGDQISIGYGEILGPDGDIAKVWDQEDIYIAKGESVETYEPRFTYHGFQFVKVTGYPGNLTSDDIVAKAVYTDSESTGSFSCSNQELNAVQGASEWSLRSNSHGLPTDCPTREKRGWGGDAHITAPAQLYSFESERFWEKWLRDLDDNQGNDGSQSDNVPFQDFTRPADQNWGKVQVTIPWFLYQYTGDESILREHYQNMKEYVDFRSTLAVDGLMPGATAQYGDWLALEGSDRTLVATYGYHQASDLFAKIAAVLGKDGDAATYRQQANDIAAALNRVFFDEQNHVYANGSQTEQALPLFAGIVPDEHEQAVAETLVEKIRSEDSGKLQTGFVGTRPLLFVLSEYGYEELAYNIVSQPEAPGWVYMIRNGATTLWEEWDSAAHATDENPPVCPSATEGIGTHNHRNWTLVSEWFHRVLAGIDPVEPGFEHVEIAPTVVSDLDWVEAKTEPPKGTIACQWERTDGGIAMDVTIPWNATGTVRIPDLGASKVEVREGNRLIWKEGRTPGSFPDGVKSVSRADDAIIVEIGSGKYDFELRQR